VAKQDRRKKRKLVLYVIQDPDFLGFGMINPTTPKPHAVVSDLSVLEFAARIGDCQIISRTPVPDHLHQKIRYFRSQRAWDLLAEMFMLGRER
jgi:hypothetical protein